MEEARKRAAAASERLDGARLALRERQAEERAAAGEGEGEDALPGTPVNIKELDEVGTRIRSSITSLPIKLVLPPRRLISARYCHSKDFWYLLYVQGVGA